MKEKERTERRTEAVKMIEDFMKSNAVTARVSSEKTNNPYNIFITIRRNVIKMELQDKVRVHVRQGTCYIEKRMK